MPKKMKLNFKGGGKGLVIGIALVVLLILVVGGGVAAYLLTRPQKCSKSKFNTDEKCLGGSDSSLSLYKGESTCSSTKCTQSECCKAPPPPPPPTPSPASLPTCVGPNGYGAVSKCRNYLGNCSLVENSSRPGIYGDCKNGICMQCKPRGCTSR